MSDSSPASVQPAPPAPQPPGPGWGQFDVAAPAPQGPVTLLSKVAGVIMLLFGLASTPGGSGDPLMYSALAYSVEGTGLNGLLVEIGFLPIGISEFLGGIGILRGAGWGRIIGIAYSLLIGAWALFDAVSIGGGVFPGTDLVARPILGLIFVLYAYSAIVLMFRWREPAIA